MLAVLSPKYPAIKGCVNFLLQSYSHTYSFDEWDKDSQGHFLGLDTILTWTQEDLVNITKFEINTAMYRCYLPSEVVGWIVNNIEYDWVYEIRQWNSDYGMLSNRFVFYFQKYADATVFKLRWE